MAIFWWTLPTVRTCFTSNDGRPNEEIWVEEKAYVLGREGVCMKAIFFWLDMAAEGRGNTILTRALQFQVLRNSGIQDLLSSLSFWETVAEIFFSTSRLSPFTVLMHPLLTSFIVTSDDA